MERFSYSYLNLIEETRDVDESSPKQVDFLEILSESLPEPSPEENKYDIRELDLLESDVAFDNSSPSRKSQSTLESNSDISSEQNNLINLDNSSEGQFDMTPDNYLDWTLDYPESQGVWLLEALSSHFDDSSL